MCRRALHANCVQDMLTAICQTPCLHHPCFELGSRCRCTMCTAIALQDGQCSMTSRIHATARWTMCNAIALQDGQCVMTGPVTDVDCLRVLVFLGLRSVRRLLAVAATLWNTNVKPVTRPALVGSDCKAIVARTCLQNQFFKQHD